MLDGAVPTFRQTSFKKEFVVTILIYAFRVKPHRFTRRANALFLGWVKCKFTQRYNINGFAFTGSPFSVFGFLLKVKGSIKNKDKGVKYHIN